MDKGQQLLDRGIEAYKKKQFDDAEPLLMAAFKASTKNSTRQRCACINLGFVYRKSGRYEDAITVLEKGLPFPGAFKELVSIHRFLGKAFRKMDDAANESECFRKMFSLAKLQRACLGLHVGNYVDWERGTAWLDELRGRNGSIYIHSFDGKRIDDDDLLSQADYKVLESFR